MTNDTFDENKISTPTIINKRILLFALLAVMIAIIIAIGIKYIKMPPITINSSKLIKTELFVYLNGQDRTSLMIKDGTVSLTIKGQNLLIKEEGGKYWYFIPQNLLGEKGKVELTHKIRGIDTQKKLQFTNPLQIKHEGTFSTKFKLLNALPGLQVDLLGCDQDSVVSFRDSIFEITNIPIDFIPFTRGLKLIYKGEERTEWFLFEEGIQQLGNPFPSLIN